jgi:hypothetical protein
MFARDTKNMLSYKENPNDCPITNSVSILTSPRIGGWVFQRGTPAEIAELRWRGNMQQPMSDPAEPSAIPTFQNAILFKSFKPNRHLHH